MDWFNIIGVTVIGAIMLFAAISHLNSGRKSEGKKPMGCLLTLLVIVVIIIFWYLTSNII